VNDFLSNLQDQTFDLAKDVIYSSLEYLNDFKKCQQYLKHVHDHKAQVNREQMRNVSAVSTHQDQNPLGSGHGQGRGRQDDCERTRNPKQPARLQDITRHYTAEEFAAFDNATKKKIMEAWAAKKAHCGNWTATVSAVST
jgi:hypothetical protein